MKTFPVASIRQGFSLVENKSVKDDQEEIISVQGIVC